MVSGHEGFHKFGAKGAPLLAAGHSFALMGMGENLWIHLKIYAAGGENGLHSHEHEEHAFVVLAGEAEFEDAAGTTTRVGPFEGIFLPRNTPYRFESVSAENLVMFRIGAADAVDLSPDEVAALRAEHVPAWLDAEEFPPQMIVRAGEGRTPVRNPASVPVEAPGRFFDHVGGRAVTAVIPDDGGPRMISADSHVIESPAVWDGLLPADFWPDGGQTFQVKGGSLAPADRRGITAQDGVIAEVLYPTLGLKIFGVDDAGLQEASCRAYNAWLADYCRVDPTALLGVAMIPAFDADRAVEEIRFAKAAGLAGIMVWESPHPDLPFTGPHYDPIWAEAQRLELPVSLHILTGFDYSRDVLRDVALGVAHEPVEIMRGAVNFKLGAAMNTTLDFVASGVFDRFPSLRLVLVEHEATWLPFAIQQWDYYAKRYLGTPQYRANELPSAYCARNLFATFFFDGLTANVFPWWGVDNCMWSNDFPHPNSTWPDSRRFVNETLGALPQASVEKLVWGNAARLYGLEGS